jgi:hypothetical protein
MKVWLLKYADEVCVESNCSNKREWFRTKKAAFFRYEDLKWRDRDRAICFFDDGPVKITVPTYKRETMIEWLNDSASHGPTINYVGGNETFTP